MALPTKGKQPTKGARQIVEDNKNTVNFYRTMSVTAMFIHLTVLLVFKRNSIDAMNIVLNTILAILYSTSYHAMRYMSRPKYNDNNQIVDPGLDLNMEGALGEHIKDIVILCSITQVTALLSNYFWLVLVALPLRAFWLIWVNFLGPWFFQKAPEDTEQEEKKKKKTERKIKRMP